MNSTVVKKDWILIIDDSIDLLEIQKVILESEGFNVTTANGCEEALSILGKKSSWDLVLLDFKLNNITGTEFLNLIELRLPEVFKNTPFVFYSGVDEIPDARGLGFISKLSGMNEFLVEIRKYLCLTKQKISSASQPHLNWEPFVPSR